MQDKPQSDMPAYPVAADPPAAEAVPTNSSAGETTSAPGAVSPAPPQQRTGDSILAFLREMLETVIFALLVFLLVQAVSRNYRVQSVSMQPNLYEGQYLVVNRLVYADNPITDALRRTVGKTAVGEKVLDTVFHSPQRGEVVVFTPVTNTKPDLIKRVIGIAGDRVELRQGKMYINDVPIDEPYIRPAPGQSWGPAIVGKDEIFVLGDNRGNSADSRVFGMLPLKNVIGRAWLRYWPPQEWGFIKSYDLKKQLSSSK